MLQFLTYLLHKQIIEMCHSQNLRCPFLVPSRRLCYCPELAIWPKIGLRNSLIFLLCAAAGAFWPILGKTPFNPRSEGGIGVGVGKVVPVIDKSGFSPQNPDFMGKIRVGVGEGVPVIDPLFKVEVKFISLFTCKTKLKLNINKSINGCKLD